MKKFLLSLFISLVFTCSCAFADNIKFVQVADTHLSAGSEYSVKVLKSAVEDINKQQDVSFVVLPVII